MKNSIKTKITVITTSIFIVFNIIIIAMQIDAYFNYKQLQLEKYSARVTQFKYYTKVATQSIKDLAQALAVMGYAYSSEGITHNRQDLALLVKDNLAKTPEANGCGIWYEPNVIEHQKNFSAFAFKTDGKINLEPLNQAGQYNYFARDWYYEAKKVIKPTELDPVHWSKPYPDPLSNEEYMITASTLISDGKKDIVGIATADWLLNDITKKLYEIAPTDDSIVLLANRERDFIIALKDENTARKNPNFKDFAGKSLSHLSWYDKKLKKGDIRRIGNKFYKTFISHFDGLTLILEVPIYSIYGIERRNAILGIIAQLLITIIFALIVYRVLIKNLNKPIDTLVKATKQISQGNFDTTIELNKPEEFVQLANTFNKMSLSIKEYLDDIKDLNSKTHQIEIDMNAAKQIQRSSLPSIYPNFYNIEHIDISPYMEMAQKVGGDFYDFYFLDENHIACTIADVSGKGIPAALFMMKTRIIFKTNLLFNKPIEKAIEQINNITCTYNEQGFFVTAAIAIVDLKTGEVTYINAGHNPPVIRHGNDVKYLSVPSNIVLGAFEDAKFEIIKFKLEPSDTLFLYTDGVTEARNSQHELYGNDRLLSVIKEEKDTHRSVTNIVRTDIQKYTKGAEQADDITMLGITYLGDENTCLNKMFSCDTYELETLKLWLKEFADKVNIDNSKLDKLYIAAEEVFVNICEYAYPKNTPKKEKLVYVGLKYIKHLNIIKLVFIDSGIKYNPLEEPDPDTDIDINDRDAGGMGIFMVKQMMDSVEYEYTDKHNNLKLKYHI